MNRAAGHATLMFATVMLSSPTLASAGAIKSTYAPEPPLPWSYSVSSALYLLPDEDNLFQPTVRADSRRLHLEARYNYEDRRSASFFFGTNIEAGSDAVALSLTPMLGAVVGPMAGVIPAFELAVSWKRLEAYAESEYVIASIGDSEDYFYMWSELGLWVTGWLRAGGAAQRTRVHHQERDVQPGLLVGARRARVDGAAYVFNPGRDDAYMVVSLAVSF